MKKIMYVIGHLGVGGAETMVRKYTENLNKNLFEVIIVTIGLPTNSPNENKLKKSNIKIIHLTDYVPFREKENYLKRKIRSIYKFKKFRDVVNEEKPDIIHTHLNVNQYLLVINNKKINFLHTLHSGLGAGLDNSKSLYHLTTKYCVRKKNMTLISLHEDIKKDIDKLFKIDSTLVLNNGIELEKFLNVAEDSFLVKKENNIPVESFIIGHIGRFVDVKNHSFLIRIFKEIKNKEKKAILVLIGEGELQKKIYEEVKDLGLENDVIFLGNQEKIPELLKMMDVFVFPSKYEGFGNVLIEAQAAGTYCITGTHLPKSTKVTNYIKYVDHQDPEKWALEAITPFLQEKEIYNLEDFDIKNVIKKLENIYSKE